MVDWMKNEKLFVQQLKIGNKWTEYVAEKLRENNINAYATELEIRDTVGDRHRFTNEQDILFNGMPGCLEVKSRKIKFSNNPLSYPMQTAFVDTVFGWDKKNPKPLAVALVSQITREILVVPVSTEKTWGTSTHFDKVRGITETSYTIDRGLLKTFSEFMVWLKDRQSSFI
jgi:hypothetical protein